MGIGVGPGLTVWIVLAPGTDGGIVVGKNQQAGEIIANGDLAVLFATAPQPNSPCTGDASANRYEGFGGFGSCSGAGCVGLTEINTWHIIEAATGICAPAGGGTVNRYEYDAVRGQWSLDYQSIIPSGTWTGAPFYLRLAGPTSLIVDPIPVVGDVSITMQQATTAVWKPVVSILGDITVSCEIASPPQHGAASVMSDCSQGTYTPAVGYVGTDSFVYRAYGGIGSADGTVTVNVNAPDCSTKYPVVRLTTDGAGQSRAINTTLTTTFTGNIVKAGTNKLVICRDSVLQFQAQSSVGSAHCLVNGVFMGTSGFLKASDRLVCSNNPTGADVDTFRINAQ
jgi:hypothetical protein